MPDKFSGARDNEAVTLGTSAVEYTPADAKLPINVKALVFDADGTVSYKNTTGGTAIAGFPVSKGQPMLFVPLRLTAMSGPTKYFLIQ